MIQIMISKTSLQKVISCTRQMRGLRINFDIKDKGRYMLMTFVTENDYIKARRLVKFIDDIILR
jgi:hypothetical protein